LIRLDERTLLVGLGYRTNQAGAGALSELTGLDVVTFDLPHWRGDGEVMHLLSLLSPLADDLVVAYRPLLPTRLAQLLTAGGIEIVDVPDDEFESLGANVLALAPRVALVVSGNPETRRRLERAGVEVLVYEGTELSKGDGGPTCLTCPLLRS
jgi:N-dimethylarginine dimethylaminohydrolase